MSFSRNDKPSPNSSPRPTRKVITSSNNVPLTQSQHDICSVQNLMLTNQCGSFSLHNITESTVNTNQNTNDNKITHNKSDIKMIALQNRKSAPSSSTSSSASSSGGIVMISKTNTTSDTNQNMNIDDIRAPPLPPRKSSPAAIENSNRFFKSNSTYYSTSNSSVSSASSLINLTNSKNLSSTSISRSTENIVRCCELDVPNKTPPPIPKHKVTNIDTNFLQFGNFLDDNTFDDLDEDKVIVGPAETISGVIDTRPLESRKPLTISSQTTGDKGNNLYQLQTGQNQNTQNNLKHQSTVNPNLNITLNNNNNCRNGTKTIPTKSITSNFENSCNNIINAPQLVTSASNSNSQSQNLLATITASKSNKTPQLYENVTIANSKEYSSNMPYENINLEYISRLMNEGYSKENVITALGISRNNIEMACDILHEFVSKNEA